MISPEDIQQIVSAIMETEQMKWVSAHMTEGPEHATPESAVVPPEGHRDTAPPEPAAAPPKPEAALAGSGNHDESEGWPKKERKLFACMPEPMKHEYSAMRKKHSFSGRRIGDKTGAGPSKPSSGVHHFAAGGPTAEGSVADEAAMKKDKEGTVIDDSLQKHARSNGEGEKAVKYRKLEETVVAQGREIERLRKERDQEHSRATQVERYRRLQERSRDFSFDIKDEWERIKDFSDDQFDRHVDGTIVHNYQRIVAGVDLPQDVSTDLDITPNRRKEKYQRELRDRTLDIATRQKLKWKEARAAAVKELGDEPE